ncbi:MAG TPA: ribbon-helix-helix domain-containing protein [Candidatus Nanopelagicaceae bacterium]|nr:ribbon-helix-helix domain-containing protein [Candidatus Nanopelagicaceae bacterium]
MKKSTPMQNITINIPNIYDENIQKLIKAKIVPSRSECIRMALKEFFVNEYKNMQLLGFFD